MSVALKMCPLCSFEAPTIAVVLSHLRTVHSSEPNFCVVCGLGGCASTSKSFSALYSRHHPDVIKKRKDIEPDPDTTYEVSDTASLPGKYFFMLERQRLCS